MYRRNTLRAVLSGYVAEALGKYELRPEEFSYRLAVGPLRVDVPSLLRDLQNRDSDWNEIQQTIRGIPHLDLEYQRDLREQSARGTTLERISELLSIKMVPAVSPIVRMNDFPMERIVDNCDELRAALVGTTWEWMFEERDG